MNLRTIGGRLDLCELPMAGAQPPENASDWSEVLLQSGSAALRTLLRSVSPSGGEVLVPDFICESVPRAILATGLDPVHVPVDRALDVAAKDIRSRIGNSTVAIVLPRYFGFEQREEQAVIELATECGLLTIQDCVGIADDLRRVELPFGGWAFNSLRKFLPVPDGAQLIGACAGDLPDAGPHFEASAAAQVANMRNLGVERSRGSSVDADLMTAMDLWEHQLIEDSDDHGCSAATQQLLERLEIPAMAAARIRNARALAEAIGVKGLSGGRVTAIRANEPVTVAPVAFPVMFDGDRNKLRSALASEGVFCAIHWQLSPDRIGPIASFLSDHILSLPVDYRMTLGEVDRLVMAVDRVGRDC